MLERSTPGISLGWFLLFAAALHFWLSRLPFPDRYRPATREQAARETGSELWVEKDLADRPVVETERSDEDTDAKARFHGEFRNRVKKETQGSRRGRFQEGMRLRPVPAPGGGGDTGTDQGDPAAPGPGDGLGLGELLALPQSPNRLPGDVAGGGRTLLNTDPVLYASFINRVADEIYDPWVSAATRAVDRIYAAGRRLEASVYITKVTVVMDGDGNVTSLSVLKSSGIPELDEAPKRAFWDAEPFPNPPSQMFGEDGLVRFVYEFHFEWKSSGFNIVPLI